MSRMRFRVLLATGALVTLGSCTKLYPVKAIFMNGRIAFVSETGLGQNCNVFFMVRDGGGQIVWRFHSTEEGAVGPRCKEGSPLVYGRTPAGAQFIKPAEALRTGTIYVIGGSAGGMLDGAFVLYRGGGKTVVRNLSTDSDEVQVINDMPVPTA